MVGLVSVAFAASVTLAPGDDVQGLTSSLLPGDVVTFTAGTYPLPGTVYWTALGEEGAPVRFVSEPPGGAVLQTLYGGWIAQLQDSSYVEIDGLVFESAAPDLEYVQPSGFYVANSSNITIEGITVRNVWGSALRIDGNTSFMTIRNNELAFTGDGTGINIGCGDASCWMQDSVVEYNLVHDVGGTGIYLAPGTQSSLIQHNNVFRTDDSGIAMYTTAFGPQNTIAGNAIWQTEDDGIFLEGSALVQNNLVFEIGGDGIQTNDNEGSLYDVQISHNTIAATDEYGAQLDDWYLAADMVFANNAIANPIGLGLYWEDLGFNVDYYGYTTTGGYPDTANYLSSNVVTGFVDGFEPTLRPTYLVPGGGNGDFVDVSNFDFFPTADSLLRDAGDAAGNAYIPAVDFNGTARDGAAPDVGAYEYDGSTENPGWVVQEGFKVLTPSEGPGSNDLSRGCCGGGGSDPDPAAALFPAPLLGLLALARRRLHGRGPGPRGLAT